MRSSEAASFDDERAQELALDLGGELNRYAAIGAAFTNAASSAETSAALSEAGGTALRNIAVLDLRGELQSELTSAAKGFLPLPPDTLDQALTGHAIAASRDGKSFAIVFNQGNHLVAVELDAKALMPSAGEREALLATLTGEVVALGSEWRALPSVEALSLDNQAHATREIEVADGRRIVALRRVEGWPLAVAASSRVGEALDAWYGSLPLYFFVIFGPALAGAGLAVIFVREFERRARTTEAVKNLRATKPEQARLLVRLADAERRAVESERARREFVGHMSHELRTPLNAIIGFSEVIERGVFGQHRKYSEYARDIGLAGRELHGKIGDILDFANLEGRKSAPISAPIDIVPVVRQVVDEAIPAARAKGVRLSVSLPMVAEAAADRHRRAPHPFQHPAQRDAVFAVRRHDPAAGEKHRRRRDDQCARSGPGLFRDRTRTRRRSLLPLRPSRLHHGRRYGPGRRHAHRPRHGRNFAPCQRPGRKHDGGTPAREEIAGGRTLFPISFRANAAAPEKYGRGILRFGVRRQGRKRRPCASASHIGSGRAALGEAKAARRDAARSDPAAPAASAQRAAGRSAG